MSLMKDFLAIIHNIAKLTNSVEQLSKANTKLQDKVADIDGRVIRLETRLDTYVEIAKASRLEKK